MGVAGIRQAELPTDRKRRFDARRLAQQSDKAKLWRLRHPGYDAERRRRERGPSGKHLEPNFFEIQKPLYITSSNILVAPDWHTPFYSETLLSRLLKEAEEHSVEDIAIPGDFWDCDNLKLQLNLAWGLTFQREIQSVAMVLQILVDTFKHVWFCRGNHEWRWTRTMNGVAGMDELFAMTGITHGYEVTNDNSIILKTKAGDWLLCHPRQYRQTKLSLADAIAEKYHMNVVCAHGHFFGQGWSRSGWYQICDAGGMFSAECLQYLRDITTYPWTLNGFYRIEDGYALPIEGDRKNRVTK